MCVRLYWQGRLRNLRSSVFVVAMHVRLYTLCRNHQYVANRVRQAVSLHKLISFGARCQSLPGCRRKVLYRQRRRGVPHGSGESKPGPGRCARHFCSSPNTRPAAQQFVVTGLSGADTAAPDSCRRRASHEATAHAAFRWLCTWHLCLPYVGRYSTPLLQCSAMQY
jgi:hypothetical protein